MLACIDWTPGHPTPTERALVESILSAHDPDGDRKDALAALQAARARRAALLADWQAAAPGPLRRALAVLLALHDDAWKEAKP